MALKQAEVLFGNHAGEGVDGGGEVEKTTAFGLLLPFVGVAVTVEDDALVLLDGAADEGVKSLGKVIGLLELVGELPEGFGYDLYCKLSCRTLPMYSTN